MNHSGCPSERKNQNMRKIIHNYIHCGLLGWFLEILFTAFQAFRRRDFKLPGATSIWMFPIYGLASLLAPLCRLMRRRNFVFRGLVYTSIIFTAEFTTGILLSRRELCPWNYERSRWNIAKVIRLDYAPCWFVAGLLFERLLLENDTATRPVHPHPTH
jgi:uncharacterized membrane protein